MARPLPLTPGAASATAAAVRPPHLTGRDRSLLARAVELGRRGWGRVHPNPMVGAVVARDGRVLAEGWHEEFGGAHAEVAALATAGDAAQGATLYSSLEPCSHVGKTPPCARAISEAGIARVVYWSADPGEEAGGGGDWLRSRGVRVDGPVGERADWAAENPFFHHAAVRGGGGAQTRRPYAALKLAVSLDGRIAPRGGRRFWLTGPEARAEVHRLRAGFDAVMVGAGTWRADDPSLDARGEVVPRIAPAPVLLDRRGQAAAGLRALAGKGGRRAVVVTAPERAERLRGRLGARADVVAVPSGPGGLDLGAVLQALKARGVATVLCEGGGRVGASLLSQGLADRLYLFVAPVVIGAGGVEAFPHAPMGDAALLRGWKQRLDPVKFGSDTLLVFDREAGRCSQE